MSAVVRQDSSLRRLATIGLITAAKISSAIIAMIAAVIASHTMSVADFGAISVILSSAVVVAALVDWGASIYVRKRSTYFIKADDARIGRSLGDLALAMLLRATSAGLLLTVAIVISGQNAHLGFYLALVPIGLAFSLELLTGETLRVRGFYLWAEYYGGGLRQTIYVIILVISAGLGVTVGTTAALYAVAMLLSTVLSIIMIGRARLRTEPWHRKLQKQSGARERGHFVLVGLFNILLNQLPLLFAGFAASQETAGIVRISLLFGLLMQMAISANAMFFAPKISAVARRNDTSLSHLLKQSSQFGLLGIPAGIVGIILVPFTISVLFGEAYARSVLGAQFLIAVYGILSVFGAYGQFVLLRGGERVAMGAAGVAVASQILLLPTLTYVWPLEGFALSYGVSMLISYAFLGVFGFRRTGVAPGPI